MKKLVAIALIALMLFALCACQVSVTNNEGTETAKNEQPSSDTAKESADTAKDTTPDTDEPTPAEALFDAEPRPGVIADRI